MRKYLRSLRKGISQKFIILIYVLYICFIYGYVTTKKRSQAKDLPDANREHAFIRQIVFELFCVLSDDCGRLCYVKYKTSHFLLQYNLIVSNHKSPVFLVSHGKSFP